MMLRSFAFCLALLVGGPVCLDVGAQQTRAGYSKNRRSTVKPASVSANINSTFETNTTENWQPRSGSENVSVTNAERRSGNFSLLTRDRLAEYNGCKIDVSDAMVTGARYRITVWAKLVAGSAPIDLKVSLQRKLSGSTTYHTAVPNTAASTAEWVRLTAVYEYVHTHDELFLYIESASGTSSFYIDDFELALEPPLQIQAEIPSLRQALTGHFPVGAAVYGEKVSGGAHTELLKKHFNSITAQDDMKWESLQPTEGVFNFGPADELVAFASANGMKVRGHTLTWHNQNPDWLFRDPNGSPMTPTPQNKALLLQRLETHITQVVSHFGNNVSAWDVVNEAIDENQPDGLRRNFWYQICGPEYIDRAFQAARAASSNAKLYLNDYNTTEPARRSKIFNFVQNLRNRGIPIDGVGHQMHSDIDLPSAASVIDTVNLFSSLPGIDNQITELDMSVYNNWTQQYQVIPDVVLMKQGYRYRDLFNAFRQLQGKISSVTFWGLADDDTWLSTFPINRYEAPLLFDDRLQAKPAFWGIVDPLKLAVTLSGKVTDQEGRPLRNVTVTMIDPQGVRRSVSTGTFGRFNFDGVWRFQTYTFLASSKQFRFQPKQLNVVDPVANIDFIGFN